MKKISGFIAALALVAIAASCEKARIAAPAGEETTVEFTVATPQIFTKAIADGNTVDKVACNVYDGTGALIENAEISKIVPMTGGKATFAVRLVTGQTYSFIFWAYKDGTTAYALDAANKKVTVSYTDAAANDETRDAFYAYVAPMVIKGAVNETVTLYRPFAQLNFGVNKEDIAAAKAAGIEVKKSAVKVGKIGNELNLVDGTVSGDTEASFALADRPVEDLTVDRTAYGYVAMNYVLVGKNAKTLADVELRIYTENGTEPVNTVSLSYVPLQGNYRTNILGNLFTSQVIQNIVVNPAFEEPDYTIQTISNQSELEAFLATGGQATVIADITIDKSLSVPAGTKAILDLGGKTIDGTGVRAIVVNGGELTVTGNGKFIAKNTTGDDNALINVYSGKLIVEEAYFEGANTCIAVINAGIADIKNATMKALDGGCCLLASMGGTINVNGLKFTCGGDDPAGPGACWANFNGVINIYEGYFEAVPLNNVTHEAEVAEANYCLYDYYDATAFGYIPGTITVYGGTFKGFNPADNVSGRSYVAEGYTATKTTEAGEDFWTVSKSE